MSLRAAAVAIAAAVGYLRCILRLLVGSGDRRSLGDILMGRFEVPLRSASDPAKPFRANHQAHALVDVIRLFGLE